MTTNGFPSYACRHCGVRTIHWLWRLVEPAPRTYEVLCAHCAAAQDASFTPEQAIIHAIIIIGMHAGQLEAQR